MPVDKFLKLTEEDLKTSPSNALVIFDPFDINDPIGEQLAAMLASGDKHQEGIDATREFDSFGTFSSPTVSVGALEERVPIPPMEGELQRKVIIPTYSEIVSPVGDDTNLTGDFEFGTGVISLGNADLGDSAPVSSDAAGADTNSSVFGEVDPEELSSSDGDDDDAGDGGPERNDPDFGEIDPEGLSGSIGGVGPVVVGVGGRSGEPPEMPSDANLDTMAISMDRLLFSFPEDPGRRSGDGLVEQSSHQLSDVEIGQGPDLTASVGADLGISELVHSIDGIVLTDPDPDIDIFG